MLSRALVAHSWRPVCFNECMETNHSDFQPIEASLASTGVKPLEPGDFIAAEATSNKYRQTRVSYWEIVTVTGVETDRTIGVIARRHTFGRRQGWVVSRERGAFLQKDTIVQLDHDHFRALGLAANSKAQAWRERECRKLAQQQREEGGF